MAWTRCPEIQTLAVWGKNVVLRCVNVRQMMPMVWEHWRPHMRCRAPERGLLRRRVVQPDQMPAVGLVSCASALSSRGKYSVWQHITFMSSSGMARFLSTLGMEAICGTEATSPGNCGLLKVTLNYSKSYWGLRSLFCFFEKKKKQDRPLMTSLLPYWCPPPWGLHRSAKWRFKCSVYIVYSTMNSSPSLLPGTDKRWWIVFELVPVSPYLYSIRTSVMFR